MQHFDTMRSIGNSQNAKTIFIGNESSNQLRNATLQALEDKNSLTEL